MEEFDSGGLCDGSNGFSCGNCGRSDESLDAGYETTAEERGSSQVSLPHDVTHVTKFLCPRYSKFVDAPSQKDSDLFTGEDGEVQVESCGWEVQIFEDRKPE
jgi:hypothetical protein